MLLFFVRRRFLTVAIGRASHSGAKVPGLFLCKLQLSRESWATSVGALRVDSFFSDVLYTYQGVFARSSKV